MSEECPHLEEKCEGCSQECKIIGFNCIKFATLAFRYCPVFKMLERINRITAERDRFQKMCISYETSNRALADAIDNLREFNIQVLKERDKLKEEIEEQKPKRGEIMMFEDEWVDLDDRESVLNNTKVRKKNE